MDRIGWHDTDPWVPILIPGATNVTIFQHIKPILVEGELVCYDADSLRTALWNTRIQSAVDKKAIEADGKRNKIEYFMVEGRSQNDQVRRYTFTWTRIKDIVWPPLQAIKQGPVPFTVRFYAQKVVETTP